jgi:serine/threonine protein kinase
MHQQRICHRDIKPSNILITKEKRVYIADFNVAKHVPVSGPDFTQLYLGKRPSLLAPNEVIAKVLNSIKEQKERSSKIKSGESSGSDIQTDSDEENEFEELADTFSSNNFVMRTRTAGTLAFAPPERLSENCIYT